MAQRKTAEQKEQERVEREAEQREQEAAEEIEQQVEDQVESAARQQALEHAVEEGEATKTEARQAARTKYSRERLILESEAFTGHPPHVMAGALADDERDEFTVNQAKDSIQRWLSP